MLARILGLLGLESVLAKATRLMRVAERRAREIGIGAAFGAAGAAMGLVTFVALLIAIFHFARIAFGLEWALAIVVLIPAVLTALFGAMAYGRLAGAVKSPPEFEESAMTARSDGAAREAGIDPEAASAFYVQGGAGLAASALTRAAPPVEIRKMLADAIGSVFTSAPTTGTPVDEVIHRFTSEAAATSDKTVDFAAEAISRGSRTVVFGILAATVTLGWYLARRPGRPAL